MHQKCPKKAQKYAYLRWTFFQQCSALDQILREKKVINDYVSDFSECSSYDSFEPESDPTIEDAEERLPNEIDNDESEDSDFE